jgi:hypothetical protein
MLLDAKDVKMTHGVPLEPDQAPRTRPLLSMAGGGWGGGWRGGAGAARAAGCDMVLLCNDPAGQERLLESLGETVLASAERLERMRKKGGRDLRKSVAYRESQEKLRNLA